MADGQQARTRTAAPIVEVEDLVTEYPRRSGRRGRAEPVRAVDGVSLTIDAGETLALVGESGCGKTTVGSSLLRLVEPSSGRVAYDGQDVLAADRRQLALLRRRMQIVSQDPLGAMDPRRTISDSVGEGLRLQRLCSPADRDDRVAAILLRVGLSSELGKRLPHELSGGQLQRAGIARALVVEPGFVVCDEPLSALDVSVQAEIVNLLLDLQEEIGLTYLFISHDLSVVRHIADRVAVMYRGRVVETGSIAAVFDRPRHTYTKALLSAVPSRDRTRPNAALPGEPTDSTAQADQSSERDSTRVNAETVE